MLLLKKGQQTGEEQQSVSWRLVTLLASKQWHKYEIASSSSAVFAIDHGPV